MSYCRKKSSQAELVHHVEKQINGEEEKKLYTADEGIYLQTERKGATKKEKIEKGGKYHEEK